MNLEATLQHRGIPFERSRHRPAYTSQDLAAAEHVSGYLVAKPVVVKGKAGFAMCVLAACDHVDLNRAAQALHDKDVRLATEDEMRGLFPDCELGAEPPVGTLFGMQTIMDEHLREDDYLVMQAGTHTDAIELRREDWERLCNPIIAPIAEC